ncbi:hypothetical protein ATG_04030 [Desulfurococcaceae archaeon AG1]|jgi:hypothetical protein|nr:MAG: hypothetical protein DJ555_03285 [Desulfurococcaceae archaeon]GAY25200.1 hypothetical protein ATG_04030 [Desulfurococcaceae archaeon AG1]
MGIRWKRFGEWNKCGECWASFERGVQHSNSLTCYKVGIPVSSLKIPLKDLLKMLREMNMVVKYSIFSPPLSLASSGIVIVYFSSRDDMERFIKTISPLVKKPSLRERLFYSLFVNVEWREGVSYRRGCPEYDRKFGDWRKWPEP